MHIIKSFIWIMTGCPMYLAVVSAIVGGDAASDAADAQVQAAAGANKINKEISDEQLKYLRESRDLANAQQKPFRDAGVAGNNQLAYLLGLQNRFKTVNTGAKPTAFKAAKPTDYSLQDYRDFVAKKTGNVVDPKAPVNMANFKVWQGGMAKSINDQLKAKSLVGTTKKVLNNDANFGSLNKDFSEKYVDEPFNFQADPGYQFRQEQGNRDLQGRLAAMGMTNSGAALKEGMRFNQGLADQTYNDAFNRYNTNRGFKYNAFTDRYNQFNANRTNKYNQIAGISGTGQQAANNISSQNANFGQSASNALGNYGALANQNTIGAGDARAAGYIGGANAIQSGIGNAMKFGGLLAGIKGF
jgi:hypothetical protein